MNFVRLFSKDRELRMIWRIEKDYRISYLIGSAHFFPYSFKRSLTRYIGNADTVLFEGPLDEDNMNKVVEQGSKGDNNSSLNGVLDDSTIKEINKLEYTISTHSYLGTYAMTFGRSTDNSLYEQIKGKRPWMAFFYIWLYYRERNSWMYKLDMDAFKIANEMGKDFHFLEKIDEQIAALDAVPVERIVNFLKKINKWDGYAKKYVRYYLRGDLDGLLSSAAEFPTVCESIIDKRDPILYERMKPFLEKGNTVAVVGITHIQGIRKRLLEDGYAVQSAA
ncbi:MAG TPA: TraB/GumN family protein [Thermodesulfovibrionales bacterium]|nr:TraB/GumN family protein [Thermodesulfovibrionales bacterium]